MQETVLALGALMIIMLIAMNQQRSTIRMHEQVYVREISQARDDFANLLLEGIVNEKNFDEATLTLTSIPTVPDSFSLVLGPESIYEDSFATFDDIDDFHAFRDTFQHIISADTFSFDVSFTVNYITDADSVTSVRTFTKEITAQIDPLHNLGLYANALRGRFSKTKAVFEDF